MKNKMQTIINDASKLGVKIKFKEENIINHVWNDNIIGSIEYKGFKAIVHLFDASKPETMDLDNTWIQFRLYKPNGEEIPSSLDVTLDYCNILTPFEHYEDFIEFTDELEKIMSN